MTDTVATVTQSLPIPDEHKQQITEKAGQVSNQLGSMITDQVGTRAGQAGQQASSIAGALRSSGYQLEEQGQDAPAQVLHMAANRADQLGTYLLRSDPNQILADVENLCRQQPWVVIAGGIALGFVGARFLKASGSRRSQERYGTYGNQPPRYAYPDGYGYSTYAREGVETHPTGGV
jgi:ElaB/YqjD/DUF883 family membrane-anchored ribosome-binding protein